MIRHWIKATRPKTLPASVIPVAIGSAAALSFGNFKWHLSLIALVCAVLIQIITNYLNEVYDYYRGADTKERKGPQRVVASGVISPKKMLTVSLILIAITFLLGLILVDRAGVPILIIGILSLIFAYAYTGGPYPLAYKGLGDIFVMIFFGIVAVCGTFYVQTLTLTPEVFIASLGPGLLSMNLLGVNNIRDIETDKKAGKNTLAVKLGRKNALIMYYVVNFFAFLVPVCLAIMMNSTAMLLPLAAFPYSIVISKKLSVSNGAELNKLLAATGKLLLFHGTLTVVGFVSKLN